MGTTKSSMAAVVRAGRFGLCRNWKYQNVSATFARTLTTSKKNEETATISEKIASHSISDADAQTISTAAQKKWASYGFLERSVRRCSHGTLDYVSSLTLVFMGG